MNHVSIAVNLQDDLALALKAESVRIDRIAGRSTLGVEVPNPRRGMIRLHRSQRQARVQAIRRHPCAGSRHGWKRVAPHQGTHQNAAHVAGRHRRPRPVHPNRRIEQITPRAGATLEAPGRRAPFRRG